MLPWPLGLVGKLLFGRWVMSEIDRSLKILKALVEAEALVPAQGRRAP